MTLTLNQSKCSTTSTLTTKGWVEMILFGFTLLPKHDINIQSNLIFSNDTLYDISEGYRYFHQLKCR